MIKNYKQFLLEWGTDANKPQIKIGDRVIDEVDIRSEEELEEDEDKKNKKDKDLPILKDTNESVSENDPYGEERDDDLPYAPEVYYTRWEGEIYDFFKQLKDEEVDNLLKLIADSTTKDKADDYIEDLYYYIEDSGRFGYLEMNAIRNDIYDLFLLCDFDEDEDDSGPDPDEYHDMKAERDYEREYGN